MSLVNSLTALGVDVALCFLLVPSYGITGAGLAWALASALKSGLAVLQVRATLSIQSFGPAAGIVAAANVVCLGVPIAVLSLVGRPDFLDLVVVAVPCGVVYLGALACFRGPLHLVALRGLVRRG